MKGNIFTGNQQPSAPNKIFTFNPTNSVNLLGQNHNQAPNQNNQNAQNQPLFNVPLQNNIANSVQNQNPLVTDSLKENHSFVDIRNKVYNRQTLTDSEINFFKMGGLKYFKKDESKSPRSEWWSASDDYSFDNPPKYLTYGWVGVLKQANWKTVSWKQSEVVIDWWSQPQNHYS